MIRMHGVAILADVIKIEAAFIKIIFKDPIKIKAFRNYVSKWNLYMYFLIQQTLLISSEKLLMSTEVKWCVTLFIYFFDLI